ncbi:hypothetical protein B0H16DRAFT_1405368 [Mycena metata]|uniref:F-box domain-containing protein n=1 Tax=Mycena metata TaxID=1033252 RepID=A0AAD7K746_9AGAR|nr:hypothetical protein B0H16DRAFT_1405368 [Mycena metata]
MHRALGIPELVELICSQLTPARCTSYDKKGPSLAALARTSKGFCDPALDILWRQQTTITNLLNCMPEGIWKITQGGDDEFKDPDNWDESPEISICLQRCITSSDWDRPLFYMHRVRSFEWDSYLFLRTPEVFDALSLSRISDPSFPNLERLSWSPYPRTAFPHIRLFLAPRITTLTLNGIQTLSNLTVLTNLAVKCPNLKSVFICTPGLAEKPEAIGTISTFVRSLSDVESLAVGGIDRAALAFIAQLPTLKSLSFGAAFDTSITSALHNSSKSANFPALSQLFMPSLDSASSLISKAANCSLTEFHSAATTEWPTNDIAREFYGALATHCVHSSLTKIIVLGPRGSPIITPGNQLALYSVGGDVLTSLFCFTNLVRVSLSHPVGFDLDDSTLNDLTIAWPQIEYLCLQAGSCQHMHSRVTLEGLYAFAANCPRLCVLKLTFDATTVPPVNREKKAKRVAQQTLRILDVACAPLQKPKEIAICFSLIFPQLRSIKTLYEDWQYNWEGDEEAAEAIDDPQLIESNRLWKKVETSLVRPLITIYHIPYFSSDACTLLFDVF